MNICKSIPRSQEKNRSRETVKQQSLIQGNGCLLKRIADEAKRKEKKLSDALVLCFSVPVKSLACQIHIQ